MTSALAESYDPLGAHAEDPFPGVGKVKAERYLAPFLTAIREHEKAALQDS